MAQLSDMMSEWVQASVAAATASNVMRRPPQESGKRDEPLAKRTGPGLTPTAPSTEAAETLTEALHKLEQTISQSAVPVPREGPRPWPAAEADKKKKGRRPITPPRRAARMVARLGRMIMRHPIVAGVLGFAVGAAMAAKAANAFAKSVTATNLRLAEYGGAVAAATQLEVTRMLANREVARETRNSARNLLRSQAALARETVELRAFWLNLKNVVAEWLTNWLTQGARFLNQWIPGGPEAPKDTALDDFLNDMAFGRWKIGAASKVRKKDEEPWVKRPNNI